MKGIDMAVAVPKQHEHADISHSLGLLTGKVSSIAKLLYTLIGIGGAMLVAVVGGIVALVLRLGG